MEAVYKSGSLGTLLGQVHGKNFPLLATRAQEFVISDIARRIGITGELTQVLRLANYHTFGDKKMFATLRVQDDLLGDCTSDVNPCEGVSDVKPPCRDYCRLIENSTQVEDFLEEVLELSVPKVENSQSLEHSILAGCSWQDEEDKACWSSVLTDQGVCFTDQLNGEYNI